MQDNKRTDVRKIPKEWKVVKVRDLGAVITGTTPRTAVKEYWGGPYPFVTPTDITETKYVGRTGRTVSSKGVEKGRLVPKDSVLVTCIASIGKIAMASQPCITNQQINAIICKPSVDPHYIYYAIDSATHILRTWAGQTQKPIVKKSLFEKFPIALPPLPEQQKIAFILSTVDKAIQKTDEIVGKTEMLKRGLMQRLLTRGIGHTKFKQTELGEIPEAWRIERLGKVLSLCQYGLSVQILDEGKYPIIRMNNLESGYIIDNDLRYVDIDDDLFSQYRLEKGDILFNRTNSYELVGKVGIFLLHGDFTFASYLIRLRTNPQLIYSPYLNLYLNLEKAQNKLKSLATRGVSQSNINAKNLKSVKIPIPRIDEQEKIAGIIELVDQKIQHEKQKRILLENTKSGLMQILLNGKVRVKVA